jgi:DNA-binding transcriptional ArsR family regulator
MTAGEVAAATGLARATVSSTLSRLTRTGAVSKAARGYQLADIGVNARSTPKTRQPKLTPSTTRSAKAGSAQITSLAADGPPGSNTGVRTAPGSTKAAVLAALAADRALTAGEVASATGLARATVSTTLSRLSKSGEVVKADRGYRLPG